MLGPLSTSASVCESGLRKGGDRRICTKVTGPGYALVISKNVKPVLIPTRSSNESRHIVSEICMHSLSIHLSMNSESCLTTLIKTEVFDYSSVRYNTNSCKELAPPSKFRLFQRQV